MSGRATPLVTVLIPVRNEAPDLEECLAAVAAQDHPLDRLEVVVVDGCSSDDTAGVARRALDRYAFGGAAVLENEVGTTPSNLNVGLAAARGEFVCRVDARSIVPSDYVRRCVEILGREPEIRVVGGAQLADAGPDAGVVERGIARALRNPLTTGMARYRRARTSGPADTVYLGAFRTHELRAAGGWREELHTNQDFELNRRLGASGTVWFEEGLAVGYRPRRSLRSLGRQYRRFGRWKAAGWLEGVATPGARHLLLLPAPLVAVVVACRFRRAWPAMAAVVVVATQAHDPKGARHPLLVVTSATASILIVGAWFWGLVEQVIRHQRGERLIRRS